MDAACLTLCPSRHDDPCLPAFLPTPAQGPGAAAFSWRKRDRQQRQAVDAGGGGGGEEGSLFVEPLRWMGEGGGADSVVGGAVQGKLYCPKCQARLGSFNWAGTQSSSGAWVTPAFQVRRHACLGGSGGRQGRQRRGAGVAAGSSRSAWAAPWWLGGAATPRQMCVRPGCACFCISQRLLWEGAARRPAHLPAPLQLHLSKLDAIESGPPAALAGIRQPRMLSSGSVGSGGAAPPSTAAATALAADFERSTLADAPAGSAGSAAAGDAAVGSGVLGGSGSGSTNSGSCPRFQYLVLDCDGVLVDSERMSCEALRQAILQVGPSPRQRPRQHAPASARPPHRPALRSAATLSRACPLGVPLRHLGQRRAIPP